MFKVQEVTFQNDHHNFAYEHFLHILFTFLTKAVTPQDH